MKQRLGKFGTIFITLALCLALTGAGFANWSETVTINGEVNTGTVCLKWIQPATSIDPCDPPTIDWTCDPGFDNVDRLDKDVGCTTVTIEDDHTVKVTLDNVYPCYYNSISLHENNCGTIPIRLMECTLTYPDPTTGAPVTVALPDSTIVYIPGDDQYGGVCVVYKRKFS